MILAGETIPGLDTLHTGVWGDRGSEDTNLSSSRVPSKLAMEGLVASEQVVLRGP